MRILQQKCRHHPIQRSSTAWLSRICTTPVYVAAKRPLMRMVRAVYLSNSGFTPLRLHPLQAGVAALFCGLLAFRAASVPSSGTARARCSQRSTCPWPRSAGPPPGRLSGQAMGVSFYLHVALAQGGQVPLAVLAAGEHVVHILRRFGGGHQAQLTGGVVRGGGHITDRDDAFAILLGNHLHRGRVQSHRTGDRHVDRPAFPHRTGRRTPTC